MTCYTRLYRLFGRLSGICMALALVAGTARAADTAPPDFQADKCTLEKTDDGFIMNIDEKPKGSKVPVRATATAQIPQKTTNIELSVKIDTKTMNTLGVVIGGPKGVQVQIDRTTNSAVITQNGDEGEAIANVKLNSGPMKLTIDLDKKMIVFTAGKAKAEEALKAEVKSIDTIQFYGMNGSANLKRDATFSQIQISGE